MAGTPASPLYTLTFHQTPASAAATVRTAGHNATLLTIVRIWIPVILGVLGLLLASPGLGLILNSRRPGGRPAGTGSEASKAIV
jgi:hypothetical protein